MFGTFGNARLQTGRFLLLRSKQVWGKVVKPEESPNRKPQGSKRVGGKVVKPEESPNRKLKGSKRVGGKVGKPAIKPQLASGVAGTAGLFVHHVQLSVGDDGFCAGTFATVGT